MIASATRVRLRDRAEAGRRLAEKLAHYRGTRPLVLAVPRGAVPVARTLAEDLGGDLDVVLVHKLSAPGNPELAVGAVTETGRVRLGAAARRLGVSQRYLEREVEIQLGRLRERRRRYTAARAPLDPRGRTVIVVDDGVATGSTLLLALEALRELHPARLVAAVPVAPPETVERLAAAADEVVCLIVPDEFKAVGQFYEEFSQVEDEQVVAALAAETAAEEAAAVVH